MVTENKSNIKIINTSNYDDFCFNVAKQIRDQLNKKPDSRLALPAGHSPRGYYNLLAQDSQFNKIDWCQSECFALDDYLDAEEKHSFQTFLETHLYRFTNLRANAKFNPRSYDNYDQLIAEHGGIDLCLLGLGVNGHIAFNEPPTIQASWTHCVFLTKSTREANKDEFISPTAKNMQADVQIGVNSPTNLDGVPSKAVTIGIATIMASKKIILAVSSERKREALINTLKKSSDPSCPASYLTTHPDLLVITDFKFN